MKYTYQLILGMILAIIFDASASSASTSASSSSASASTQPAIELNTIPTLQELSMRAAAQHHAQQITNSILNVIKHNSDGPYVPEVPNFPNRQFFDAQVRLNLQNYRKPVANSAEQHAQKSLLQEVQSCSSYNRLEHSIACTQLLLALGVKDTVNKVNPMQPTALFYAQHPKQVELLINSGSNPNQENSSYQTALFYIKDPITGQTLIKKGANINHMSTDYSTNPNDIIMTDITPLDYHAAIHRNLPMTITLLKFGAEIRQTLHNTIEISSHYNIDHKKAPIITALVAYGADTETPMASSIHPYKTPQTFLERCAGNTRLLQAYEEGLRQKAFRKQKEQEEIQARTERHQNVLADILRRNRPADASA